MIKSFPSVLLLDPDNFTPSYDVKLLEALTRLGWKVTWVTSNPQYESMPQCLLFSPQRLFFRTLKGTRYRASLNNRFMLPIRRLLKLICYFWGVHLLNHELRLKEKGILHVQWSLFPWIDLMLWNRWRKRGWIVVYTCHDPLPLSGTLPKGFSRLNTRLCFACDAVIVHGQWARGILQRSGVKGDKIHIISPGSPTDPFNMSQNEARRILGLKTDVPSMLFLGYIKPYKGLNILIESLPLIIAEVKHVQLLVAGEAVESIWKYKKRISSLGLKDVVHWSNGYLSNESMRLYLAAANVVVLPYLEASSSGVILQAYSAGRPVVASAVGDLPSMVEDQKTGLLVPPKDIAALARAVSSILNDEETARQMGERGRIILESRFNWSRAARDTEAVYLRLLEN